MTGFNISFETTPAEFSAIRKIIDRASDLGLVTRKDRMGASMDLSACHANGCPMDFDRLLAADDFNFIHDFRGIERHLDRSTGKLAGHFLPRFAKPEASRAA